ncbi:putative Protein arginine methyltransferase NDUFAF7 like protein [Fusarium oxysporum f. sp. albedinis]|nr:putative Protein arginine methyltransferase NDUFAF7 like protein [Fusarium oxysporum f. sp. albedinis]
MQVKPQGSGLSLVLRFSRSKSILPQRMKDSCTVLSHSFSNAVHGQTVSVPTVCLRDPPPSHSPQGLGNAQSTKPNH